MGNISLPVKLDLPNGQILRISLRHSYDIIANGLPALRNRHEVILAIFTLLVDEAMGYGTSFGDTRDAIEYINLCDLDVRETDAFEICSKASDSIYTQLCTYVPDFGTNKYLNRYSHTIGENADVLIRIYPPTI